MRLAIDRDGRKVVAQFKRHVDVCDSAGFASGECNLDIGDAAAAIVKCAGGEGQGRNGGAGANS